MTVERIYTRPSSGGALVEHDAVQVHAAAGVVGDRYYGAGGEPGQNITFVEAEEIEAFARAYGRAVDFSCTGRNVVVRGVRLNELVGRQFTLGGLRFLGVELCEPCHTLGRTLATSSVSSAQVVRHWVHRAGLRADALCDGTLSVGAKLEGAA